jgi:hypothetical protein
MVSEARRWFASLVHRQGAYRKASLEPESAVTIEDH